MRIASHKLDSLNSEINKNLNQPHLVKYASWYSIAISLLIGIARFLILEKILKHIGLIYICKREFNSNTDSDQHGCLARIYNRGHYLRNHGPVTPIRMSSLQDSEEPSESALLSAALPYRTPADEGPVGRTPTRTRDGRLHNPAWITHRYNDQ